MIELNAQTAHFIALAAGFLSPLAVGFVTKQSWPSKVKALLNFGFATIATVLANVIIDPGQSWQTYGTNIFQAFVVAFTGYTFWKKTGVATKVQNTGITDEQDDATAGHDAGLPPDAGIVGVMIVIAVLILLAAGLLGFLLNHWLLLLAIVALYFFYLATKSDSSRT